MPTTTLPNPATTCTPAVRVTRSLLGYGVIAGPFYVIVSLAQALTRPGFDLTRHEWSLLANGAMGWIQIGNFVLTGLMVVAAAVGFRRALRPAPGSVWAPRLLAVYGLSLIGAGILRADPADGFPLGTPPGPAAVSWHGLGHLAAGAIGFACLIAACFVLARRLRADARSGLAMWSRVTGIGFLAGFVGIAAGSGSVAANLAFTVAVIAAWIWLSAVSAHLYRTSPI
jgi:hypothetical membrane protein